MILEHINNNNSNHNDDDNNTNIGGCERRFYRHSFQADLA